MKKLILLLCLLITCCSCREKIIHGLNEAEANKLIAQLYTVNADPRKEQQPDGHWVITVPSDQASRVVRYLDDIKIIKDSDQVKQEATSVISGRDEQRFKFERSLSREIEYTLSNIKNVLQVRVHLNLPPRDPFFGKKLSESDQGSASVLLVVTKDFATTKKDIQHLVAGAAGLSDESVAVLQSFADISLGQQFAPAAAPLPDQAAPQRSFIVTLWDSLTGTTAQVIISLTILLGGAGVIFFRRRKRKNSNFSSIVQTLKSKTVAAV